MDNPFLWTLVAAIFVTQAAVFDTTVYLHRTAAHLALEMNKYVAWGFRFVLWITTGQKRREWVAVHRKHHAFTDKAGDPHSPLLEGFWSVQLGNVVHYVRATRDKDILTTFAPDIQDDWSDRWLFNHGKIGLAFGTIMLCIIMVLKWGLLAGLLWGLLAAFIHFVLYVFVVSSSINGLCHTFGYKNFDNTATNLQSVAFLTAGEGLHNNHHGRPRCPKFSSRRLEFDPAWLPILALMAVGLATPYRGVGGLK